MTSWNRTLRQQQSCAHALDPPPSFFDLPTLTLNFLPVSTPAISYVDHVPVKADLSDLEDQIRWCRENDDKCKEIGQNAMKFYEKYVSRTALLDYVEMACKQMAKRYKGPPGWFEPPPAARPPPNLRKPDTKCFEDKKSHQSKYCNRCQEAADDEAKKQDEIEAKKRKEGQDKKRSKQFLAERRRKKAKPS